MRSRLLEFGRRPRRPRSKGVIVVVKRRPVTSDASPSPAVWRGRLEYALPIVLVGVLGYIAVVKTWFFHDDWVFLADAAGIAERDQSFVRIVSYDWYWRIFYPVFGLHQWGWALTRLVMHAVSSLRPSRDT